MSHLITTIVTVIFEELARMVIRFVKTKMGVKPTYQYKQQYKKAYR